MPKLTLALNAWTVEQRGDKWFYGETYRDGKTEYRGPYGSMTSVALMIARELVREMVRRRDRIQSVHLPAE